MFGKKSGVKATIDSLIGASTRMDGNVVFHGGLRIDGHVRGDVLAAGETPGMLVIGEHARVDGDIVAAHLVVSGIVRGSVTVSGLVDLQPKARVSGDVRYRSIEIRQGAIVEGMLSQFDGELARPGLKLAAQVEGPPTAGSTRQINQRTATS